MAGYSKRPLVAKLGIREGDRVALLGAPEGFEERLEPLPERVRLMRRLGGERDFIHLFAPDRTTLRRRFPQAQSALVQDGMLWVSWPKKSSGVETDIAEGDVRSFGLERGLVDVKVCAVDEIWSGLKFVVRRRDRGGTSGTPARRK